MIDVYVDYFVVVRDMDDFFSTEKLNAVVHAKGADRGGRSASKGHPSPPHMDVFIGDRRPPGSSGTSQLIAPA